jgi:hypothetical protein
MSLLAHIEECNRFAPSAYIRFMIAGKQAGWISPKVAHTLCEFKDVFVVESDQVSLDESLSSPEARTKAVGRVIAALAAQGAIPPVRNELYAVAESWGGEELFRLDRVGVPVLGVLAAGVHLNGFVGRGSEQKLWIARRSKTKPIAPGKLDHLVAGGQPVDLGLMENLIKECDEEASIPESLARKSHPVGAIRYCFENYQGVRNDLIFCYDLECPEDFTPRANDGEVESFELWPVGKVLETMRTSRDFKFNVPLVLIDFMIRHGHIGPENEPEYLKLIRGLRA